jgi:hypothetical protein
MTHRRIVAWMLYAISSGLRLASLWFKLWSLHCAHWAAAIEEPALKAGRIIEAENGL